jgi:hypothetical protein
VRLLALLVLCACARHEPLDDCSGDLGGVWRDGSGHRYDVIPGAGDTWEMYPMFDDRPTDLPPGVVAAPSVLDLPRGKPDGDGKLTRRFERGAASCGLQTVAHLHDCKSDRIAIDVIEPTAPIELACPTEGVAPAQSGSEPVTWSLVRD